MMGETYGQAVTTGIVIAAGGVLLLAAAVIGLLSVPARRCGGSFGCAWPPGPCCCR